MLNKIVFIYKKTVFPIEIPMYDTFVLREALNNGITYQSYLNKCKMYLIVKFIEEYNAVKKIEIEELLSDKFSSILTKNQKEYKLKNLLKSLSKKENIIEAIKKGKNSYLVLKNNLPECLPNTN